MNQVFSISFVGLSLSLLLWFAAVTIHPCGAGLAELPITTNPQNFGSEDRNQYPILTIKADGNRFFKNDWISDVDLLRFKSSIQTSDFLYIRADARLPFGEVRKTLEELKKYRTQGIVLMAERKVVEQDKILPFQEYLIRLSHCGY